MTTKKQLDEELKEYSDKLNKRDKETITGKVDVKTNITLDKLTKQKPTRKDLDKVKQAIREIQDSPELMVRLNIWLEKINRK